MKTYDERVPQEVGADHQVDLWYAVPPWPASLSELAVPLTPSQQNVLRALQTWHWRYSPTPVEVGRMLGVDRRVARATLISLRRMDFVSWIDDDPRTIHLTPLGQRAVGLYVGPVALSGEPQAFKMPVFPQDRLHAVLGAQRVWRRRWKTPLAFPNWKRRVESASLYRRWKRGQPGQLLLHRQGLTPADYVDPQETT